MDYWAIGCSIVRRHEAMRMNERSLELDKTELTPQDYPPEYLEDYARWLAMLEAISNEEFDREQQ